MYGSGASRYANRYNRRKRTRDPPLAVIGNVTSPVHPIGIDERTFRDAYLPMALANQWIKVPKLTKVTNELDTNQLTAILDISEDLYNTALFYVTVPLDHPGNTFGLEITYFDGSTRVFYSETLGDTGKGEEWVIQITPICVSCLPSSGARAIAGSEDLRIADFELSNIKKVELWDGVIFNALKKVYLYGIALDPPEVTARPFSLWKPLH